MIKGCIFDFDGTLFDSMGIWETAGADYLRSVGRDAEDALHKTLEAMSLMQAAVYLKQQYALPFSEKEIINGINETIADYYRFHTLPKEGVIAFLSYLQSRGIRMCIATATDRHLIEAALSRCDMLPFFDAIFTCSEVGHGKDEPHIFEAALAFWGMEKSEAPVFEDAYYAAKTAKDAGFYVVGVYDRYEKRTNKIKEFADRYIGDFSECKERIP